MVDLVEHQEQQSIGFTIEQKLQARRRNAWLGVLVRLFKTKPLGAFGFVIVALLLLVAIFANLIAPYNYREQNLSEALQSPGAKHLLGTDQLGRDLFSRIVIGAQVSMLVAFACVFAFLIIAIVFGMGTGYFGGYLDMIVQRFVDGWMVIPTLLILLAMVSVIGQGLWQMIAVLSIDRGISTCRVLRGEALSLKESNYVEAARAVGASHARIFLIHMLPNAFATIIVMATISLGAFILAEAALSFLGYGIPPPFPTWGSMLSGSGLSYMQRAPWLAIWPGVALTLAVWAFNVMGDAMRDLLDPRLRGSR
jgi:peptide/nickel transport system permease protein